MLKYIKYINTCYLVELVLLVHVGLLVHEPSVFNNNYGAQPWG